MHSIRGAVHRFMPHLYGFSVVGRGPVEHYLSFASEYGSRNVYHLWMQLSFREIIFCLR